MKIPFQAKCLIAQMVAVHLEIVIVAIVGRYNDGLAFGLAFIWTVFSVDGIIANLALWEELGEWHKEQQKPKPQEPPKGEWR